MTQAAVFVIVGGGLAAGTAVSALREEGFDGRLVLVGEETELPYERPPLSKDYLRGEAPREQSQVHDAAFYAEHDVELMLGRRVTLLDPAAREAELDGGTRLPYERLLLAPGAAPRRLDVPGAELEGVMVLRTLADCDALRARIAPGARVVVVGGGWIACEVAASARQLGADVTMAVRGAEPLERALGREVGAFYAGVHRGEGVDVRTGVEIEAVEGGGAAEAVRLRGGGSIPCDVVVAGLGVVPRTELAAAAGLAVDDGVVVDERLVTGAPAILAAGDAATAFNTTLGRRVRFEHWETARVHGALAARSMLGLDGRYDHIPYAFSDQFDVGMEYSGAPERWDRVVIRGELESREFIAFWLTDGRVTAGMNVGVWDVQDAIRALIAVDRPVDAARLADPAVPLEELAPQVA